MVSEKRFVVETVEITDCDTDVSRIAKVITDTDETYSYEDLYEVAELLNEQQATIIKQDEEIKKLKRTERSWKKIHCCNKESDNCGIVIEQQATISQLKEEEKLYAQEILRLNTLLKQYQANQDLGGGY